MTTTFRDYLFPSDDPRISGLRSVEAPDYLEVAKKDSFAGPMIEGWAKLYPEPFVGVTSDGVVRSGLFELGDAAPGEAAPGAAMFSAAEALLDSLSTERRAAVSYPVDAHEWRSWANPEFTQFPIGLRLENIDGPERTAVLDLVSASLSPTGAQLVRTLMRVNAFLGHEVGLPQLMNEYSYQFALFGEPSLDEPWGWSLYGHHAALNCLIVGEQLVLSPVFLAAEPSIIAERPDLTVFSDRIAPARTLMAALAPDVRDRVISYRSMVDPAMPPGRIHPGDERHLAGCFQDNRVIPYEGVLVAELGADAYPHLIELIDSYLSILPDGPASARRREIQSHFDETYFSWIGGFAESEPFYFRIQSPVVILELDHHSGVFLSNSDPAQFHIHTVMRTPNGNDYGRVLLSQKLGRELTP